MVDACSTSVHLNVKVADRQDTCAGKLNAADHEHYDKRRHFILVYGRDGDVALEGGVLCIKMHDKLTGKPPASTLAT